MQRWSILCRHRKSQNTFFRLRLPKYMGAMTCCPCPSCLFLFLCVRLTLGLLCFHEIGGRRSFERRRTAVFSHYAFLQRYVSCTAGFLAQTNLSARPQERMSSLFNGACRVPGNSVATSPEFKRVAQRRLSPALVARRIYDVIGGKQIDAVCKSNSISS
jgi:hypothetical protein